MTSGAATPVPRGYVFPADIAGLHHQWGHSEFRPAIYLELPFLLPSAQQLLSQHPDQRPFISGACLLKPLFKGG